jgi:hypothetical protein
MIESEEEKRSILKDLLSVFVLMHYITINFIEAFFNIKFREAYLNNSAMSAGIVFVYHYGMSSIIFARYLLRYYKIIQKPKDENQN